jgi:hypothetical protein
LPPACCCCCPALPAMLSNSACSGSQTYWDMSSAGIPQELHEQPAAVCLSRKRSTQLSQICRKPVVPPMRLGPSRGCLTCTACCRSMMLLLSAKGAASQRRSMRPPAAVQHRSSTCRREPFSCGLLSAPEPTISTAAQRAAAL